MKTIRRLTAFILIFCLTLAGASCGKQGGGDESGTEAPTEIVTEPTPATVRVFDPEGQYYSIIRSEEASEALYKTVSTLRKRFQSYFNTELSVDTDFHPAWKEFEDTEKEILVGLTNRQASIDFYERLPEGGYGYTVTDQKIVILGKNESLTALAVNAFDSKVLMPFARKTDALDLEIGTEMIFTLEKDMTNPYNLLRSGMTVIASISDRVSIGTYDIYKTSQGAASDGKYYYATLMKKVDNVEQGVIVKYDIATGKKEKVSEVLPLDHCNDMTWDPLKNELVITNMVGTKITVIDPETLTIKRTVDAKVLPGTPYGISYNAAYDAYVILAGGRVNFCDRETFAVKNSFPMVSMPYTGQGVDSDENCVYIPMSKAPDKGTNDNVIVVYEIKSGSVIGQIHIKDSIEIETMFNRDGVYYANFNTSGSAIYRLSFNGYVS